MSTEASQLEEAASGGGLLAESGMVDANDLRLRSSAASRLGSVRKGIMGLRMEQWKILVGFR